MLTFPVTRATFQWA